MPNNPIQIFKDLVLARKNRLDQLIKKNSWEKAQGAVHDFSSGTISQFSQKHRNTDWEGFNYLAHDPNGNPLGVGWKPADDLVPFEPLQRTMNGIRANINEQMKTWIHQCCQTLERRYNFQHRMDKPVIDAYLALRKLEQEISQSSIDISEALKNFKIIATDHSEAFCFIKYGNTETNLSRTLEILRRVIANPSLERDEFKVFFELICDHSNPDGPLDLIDILSYPTTQEYLVLENAWQAYQTSMKGLDEALSKAHTPAKKLQVYKKFEETAWKSTLEGLEAYVMLFDAVSLGQVALFGVRQGGAIAKDTFLFKKIRDISSSISEKLAQSGFVKKVAGQASFYAGSLAGVLQPLFETRTASAIGTGLSKAGSWVATKALPKAASYANWAGLGLITYDAGEWIAVENGYMAEDYTVASENVTEAYKNFVAAESAYDEFVRDVNHMSKSYTLEDRALLMNDDLGYVRRHNLDQAKQDLAHRYDQWALSYDKMQKELSTRPILEVKTDPVYVHPMMTPQDFSRKTFGFGSSGEM